MSPRPAVPKEAPTAERRAEVCVMPRPAAAKEAGTAALQAEEGTCASPAAGAYTATHWGVYRPIVHGGRLREMRPAEWDGDPSPIGASVPGAVDGPVRVRRPAVRAGFLDPRTRHASRGQRGREPFVEVPWDEALDLAAEDLARVKAAHGNEAIYGGSYGWSSAGRFHHAQGQLHRFLNGFGGHVYSEDTYSLGAGRALLPRIVADMDTLLHQHTSWDVLAAHCGLFVAFGGLPLRNTQVSPGGASDHGVRAALRRLAAAGTAFVNVGPARDDLAGVPQAQWLAIRPGTDTAFMLGLAHVLIAEGRHDAAFLASHCTGFERVRAYVLGESDGVPKTPAWAAAQTGAGAEAIAGLARRMAGTRTMVNAAYALQRARFGEQPFWMVVTLAALLGQIGLPGGGFGLGYGCMNNTGGGGNRFSGARLPQGANAVRDFIPVARIADMLLQPGQPYAYNGQRRRYPHVRLIHWAGGNAFHHHQDLNRLVQAWRRPETIITHEPYWTAQARYSDIVLPATTPLERDDIGSAATDRFMVAMKAAIAPVGEARDDYDILRALARRLGFEDAFSEGLDAQGWLRRLHEDARPRAEQHGVALPAFDEFWARGVFEVPRPAEPVVLLEAFRRDPERHPLATPSGRVELYSETIAGFGYADCPGHAAWLPPEPSPWPLHLLSHQPATRLHSQYDHGAASLAAKVAGREPIALNPADARARGIGAGDVVRVFNDLGAFLAGAVLDDGLLRGVARIATGAWYDPLEAQADGSLDKHGNANLVTPDVGSSRLGQGCSAQSARVEVERWAGEVPAVTAFAPPALQPCAAAAGRRAPRA